VTALRDLGYDLEPAEADRRIEVVDREVRRGIYATYACGQS
jgi:hypothetical protein